MEIVDRYHEKSIFLSRYSSCFNIDHIDSSSSLGARHSYQTQDEDCAGTYVSYPPISSSLNNALFFIVHILSGDLVLHKRTLTPIKSLVYGLRRYDLDRCIALVGSKSPDKDKDKVVGFMSHQSKVYLVSWQH